MVKPVKFAHVVYMTRRFDEMIAWYCNVFEADVVYENPPLVEQRGPRCIKTGMKSTRARRGDQRRARCPPGCSTAR